MRTLAALLVLTLLGCKTPPEYAPPPAPPMITPDQIYRLPE